MTRAARPFRPFGRGATLASALLAALTWSQAAHAQLGGFGDPITTNDYAIDLYQGPVLASTRVMGLGGAYVAVAEFTEGNTQNPAAPAVRTAYAFSHTDYDIGLGFTFPSTITRSDFFNTGKNNTDIPQTDEQGWVATEVSGNLQFGRWGLGAALRFQQYDLLRAAASVDRLQSRIATIDIQLARAFMEGQLVVGTGVRTGALSVVNENPEKGADATLFDSAGATYQIGTLWRPNDQQYRIGGAFRGGIRTEVDASSTKVLFADDDDPGDDLYLPNSVEVPWELAVGFAYQFGKLFNQRWYDPKVLVERTERYIAWRRADRARRKERLFRAAERAGGDVEAAKAAIAASLRAEEVSDEGSLARAQEETEARLRERYARLGRFYVLVSTALFVNGSTADAVGIESFLERKVNRSGLSTTFSPRLGVETELIPNWFVLRGGTYLEPTRFEANEDGARWHGTVGGDIRLGGWSVFGAWPDEYVWRLRGALDVSRRYLGWGIAIGGFY